MEMKQILEIAKEALEEKYPGLPTELNVRMQR
jgi:hypothetical protein